MFLSPEHDRGGENKNDPMRRIWLYLVILAFGGIALYAFFLLTPIGKTISGGASQAVFVALQPIQRMTMSVGRLADAVRSGPQYQKEVLHLQEQLESVTFDTAQMHLLESENNELRKALNFTKENGKPIAFAGILRSGTIFGQEFLLDKGSRDGIHVGDFVTTLSGVFVGRVDQITSQTSKVLLLTDSRLRIVGQVLVGDNPKGIVQGSYGTSVALFAIPQTESIGEGDTVVVDPTLSALHIPFPIGVIRRLNTTPRDLFQEAVIDPLARVDDIDTVMVYAYQQNADD